MWFRFLYLDLCGYEIVMEFEGILIYIELNVGFLFIVVNIGFLLEG